MVKSAFFQRIVQATISSAVISAAVWRPGSVPKCAAMTVPRRVANSRPLRLPAVAPAKRETTTASK